MNANEVNRAVIALSINFYQLGKSEDRELDSLVNIAYNASCARLI
jgi:hypothetical protein